MANNGFENHRLRTLVWIIRQLERRSMTLRELNDLYVRNDDLSAGEEIERRTFINHKNAILDSFGILIECDRRTNKYHINPREIDATAHHLIDNIEILTALGQEKELSSRIVMEHVPVGGELRDTIIRAMKENRKIHFRFRTFDEHDEYVFEGAPYALKLYQQRWYVVLRFADGYTDTFSLDRITQLDVLDVSFHMDPAFDIDEFFRYSFGIRVDPDRAPEVVRIKVNAVQCDYFRALPLHHSQQEVEEHPHYSIFEMLLVPTIELKFKLLSYGSLLEVLQPLWLRDIMHQEAALLCRKYDNEN